MRGRFRFDVVSAREGSDECHSSVHFFQLVRGRSALRKGVVRGAPMITNNRLGRALEVLGLMYRAMVSLPEGPPAEEHGSGST